MSIKGFQELKVWQEGRKIRLFSSSIAHSLPDSEKFSLASQILRASRSITNNIAEGYGRYHFQENIQFCRQSRGSAYELLDHFIIAYEEKYIDKDIFQEGQKLIEHFLPLLNGYIKYLVNAKKNMMKEEEIPYETNFD